MHRPSFSIVIPTFQRREVVCDAVRAIGGIRYDGPVRVVVVVDGSTDGTAEALEAIEIPFPLAVIRQDNRGAASARNRGARESAGDVILFLDDDMICQPDIVEQHAASYRDGADAVMGDIPLDPASPPGFLAQGVGLWASRRRDELAAGAPLALHDLLTGQLSIRRSVYEALGGFDEGFTAGGSFGNEDLDLGIRLLERHDVRFNPGAVAHQRYVVTPRQYLRQWRQAGQADVRFAWKHPSRAGELFAARGRAGSLKHRLVRLVAAMPGGAGAFQRLALAAVVREPDRSSRLGRLAIRLFYAARDVAYWRGVREAAGTSIAVLCYHAIADLSQDPVLHEYGVPQAAFAAQIDALIASGCRFVGAEQLLALLEEGIPPPRGAVLLTFDDCYAGLGEVARAVLGPRSIPAIAFPVASRVGAANEWDRHLGAGVLPLADAGELAQLAEAGVEIGCHSGTHRQLDTLAESDLAAETEGAASGLQAHGLARPRLFAYPYGVLSRRAKAAVRRAGFRAAFGLARTAARRKSDRFALPRFEVLASHSPEDVVAWAGLGRAGAERGEAR